MKRFSRIAVVTLALAAGALGAPAAHATDPSDAPARLVRMTPLEGLPPDTLARAAFQAAFDSVLAARALPVEKRAGNGVWNDAGTRANTFRLTTDPKAEQVWSLHVVVGAPPPFVSKRWDRYQQKDVRTVDPKHRASRGMTLSVLVLSPQAIAAGARAMPERYAFAFPPATSAVSGGAGPVGAYEFPWRNAGAVAATLALELLHTRSGDLPTGERCAIQPAQRADVVR